MIGFVIDAASVEPIDSDIRGIGIADISIKVRDGAPRTLHAEQEGGCGAVFRMAEKSNPFIGEDFTNTDVAEAKIEMISDGIGVGGDDNGEKTQD